MNYQYSTHLKWSFKARFAQKCQDGGGNYNPGVHHAVSFKSVDNSLCSTNQSIPFD